MKSLPKPPIFLLLLAVAAVSFAGNAEPDYGRLGATGWDRMLALSQGLSTPSERIASLSQAFLGTPYTAGTLVGSAEESERLVIALSAVDCFTLLDYVEALRRSASVQELPAQLTRVRYRNGRIAYGTRRHFFSDWCELPGLHDVTTEVGGESVRQVHKILNLRQDGRLWLSGIETKTRTVRYIPASAIDTQVLSRLQNGDYVGIYSEAAGLDVSHTGIVVRHKGEIHLRHASSRCGEVVDERLVEYLRRRPGLVVLRAQ